MNRIDQLFNSGKKNILSVFYTAGYPKRDDTIRIAKALQSAGVDLIEIGIPFSDPIADGPVIQASSKAAIDHGMTVKLLLEQVKEIRKTVTIPIILMGYLNPVMQFGMCEFFEAAKEAGVDGLILPDMPYDEYVHQYKADMDRLDLRNIFLVSPTTAEERIRKIDKATKGFIYAVSSSSTTGARLGFQPEQIAYFEKLKSMQLQNPFLIGFGIADAQAFSTASQYGAGAIVGSAFIKLLGSSDNLEQDIPRFIHSLRGN